MGFITDTGFSMLTIEPVLEEMHDECGATAIAQLCINSAIKIALCDDCLKELGEELKKFNDTIFCYKCDKFIMSEDGWNYGGSCTKSEPVSKKSAGCIHPVDCMKTCEDAVLKREYCDWDSSFEDTGKYFIRVSCREAITGEKYEMLINTWEDPYKLYYSTDRPDNEKEFRKEVFDYLKSKYPEHFD